MKLYAFWTAATLLGLNFAACFAGILLMQQKMFTDPAYSPKNPGAALYKYKREMLWLLAGWVSMILLVIALVMLSDKAP